MWTSLSADADYCWLAVRTDPEAKKHKGISIIIVPMDTPGITLSPLHLLGEHDINQVFFDDVRVPVDELRRRREQRLDAHHQPAQPRAGHAVLERRRRARARRGPLGGRRTPTLPDGRPVIDQDWVQLNLARVHAKLDVLAADQLAGRRGRRREGVLDIGHCSAIKVFGTEFYLEAFRLLMEVLGPAGVPQGRRTGRGAALAARGACTAAC